jgi:nitrogen fixation protein FixH
MKIFTCGQIAKMLNVDRDAVAYALRKANIKPVARAGITRIFRESTIEEVRRFLARKNKKRGL